MLCIQLFHIYEQPYLLYVPLNYKTTLLSILERRLGVVIIQFRNFVVRSACACAIVSTPSLYLLPLDIAFILQRCCYFIQ